MASTTSTSEDAGPSTDTDCDGLRILYVYDDILSGRLYIEYAEALGWSLMLASTQLEALRIVRHSLFDVILCEHVPPDLDAIALIRGIRSASHRNAETPVIISGWDLLDRRISLGHICLDKPAAFTAFKSAIETASGLGREKSAVADTRAQADESG